MVEQIAFGEARIAFLQSDSFVGIDVGHGFLEFGLFLLGQHTDVAFVFIVLFGQLDDAAADGGTFQG